MAEHPRIDVARARSFGPAAAAYDDHRPSYPDDAVDLALDGAGRRVLDLGAGTGKLTRSLLARDLDVVAVEPDPGMLAVLRDRLPPVDSRAGGAEEIPLDDGSVDAIVAGQALHWFELDRATPEMARVLRPGGVLAGLWNSPDDEVAWVAELGEFAKLRSNPAGGGLDPNLPGQPWFGDGEQRVVRWTRERTTEQHIADVATHSWALTSDAGYRDATLDKIRDFLTERFGTSSFPMPMRTIVWRAHRA